MLDGDADGQGASTRSETRRPHRPAGSSNGRGYRKEPPAPASPWTRVYFGPRPTRACASKPSSFRTPRTQPGSPTLKSVKRGRASRQCTKTCVSSGGVEPDWSFAVFRSKRPHQFLESGPGSCASKSASSMRDPEKSIVVVLEIPVVEPHLRAVASAEPRLPVCGGDAARIEGDRCPSRALSRCRCSRGRFRRLRSRRGSPPSRK